MAENLSNDFATSLAAAITSTDATSISVASATGAPAANFRIRIDAELMLVTAVAGTTWTVTRGAEGTTAATHLIGVAVVHVLTAAGFLQTVRDTLLTGLSLATSTAITAADTVLTAIGKLQASKFDKTGGELSGDLNFTGTGPKITADLSSSPGRLVVQNSVVNGNTYWTLVPNGMGTSAQVNSHNSSDWRNSTFSRCGVNWTTVYHTGNAIGTGAACTEYQYGTSPTNIWSVVASGVQKVAGGANAAIFERNTSGAKWDTMPLITQSLGTTTGIGFHAQGASNASSIHFDGPANRFKLYNLTAGAYVGLQAASLIAGDPAVAADSAAIATCSGGSIGLLSTAASGRGVYRGDANGGYQGWMMVVLPGNNHVQLGTEPPAGSSGAEIASAAFVRAVHASDSRIKSELEPVTGVLDKLGTIKAYTFQQQCYDARKLGSIAQDWQAHWPEATPEITYDGEQRLSIDPLAAIAILTQALNELHEKVKRLEAAQ